jgi:hypothetical protein
MIWHTVKKEGIIEFSIGVEEVFSWRKGLEGP